MNLLAMNHRALACTVALFALSAACGGEQPPAAQPTNPPPSASASAAPTEAPAPSAAPSAPTAPVASAAPAASASAAPAGPTPPGPGEWDKWSKDQKLEYMKVAVMPKMGALFHEYDATKYAETRCVLCHGSGAKTGGFKMPNPDLPKLPAAPAEFKKLHDKFPKMFEFMMQKVEPQMAALLGEEPYDPKTQKGFGCFDCHTMKK
jgi:hypothetical protein